MATMSRMRKMKIDRCLVMSVCLLLIHVGAGSQAGTDPSRMTLRCAWSYASSRVDITGAVSCDGRYVAFEDRATGDLAVRDLISGQDRRLTHNKAPGEGSLSHAELSRDNRHVAYSWRHRGGSIDLRLISIDGSQNRVLFQHDDVIRIEPEGWSPDGRSILTRITRKDRTHQIALISTADGSLRVLKNLGSRQDGAAHLSLSPDGRFIAYDFHPMDDPSHEDISILSIDGDCDTPLVQHPADDNVLGWSSDGKWVLFRGDRSGVDDMWAIRVTADGKPEGEPQLIEKNMAGYSGRGSTQDGSFFYETGGNPVDTYVASLDLEAGKVTDPRRASQRPEGETGWCQWSWDGEHLLYLTHFAQRWWPRNPRVLVVRTMETGQEREISLPPEVRSVGYAMPWSPDGRSILISRVESRSPLRWELCKLDVTTGEITPIVPASDGVKYPVGWSPDRRKVFFMRENWDSTAQKFRNGCILTYGLETGQEEELYRTANTGLGRVVMSPDRQLLAFASGERPTATTLMVLPTAGGKVRELFRVRQGDIDPQVFAWTPDGRDVLFVRRPQGNLSSSREELRHSPAELWRISAEGGEPEKLELAAGVESIGVLRVHPHGKQIAFTRWNPQDRELWVMKNFLPD